MNEQMRDRRAKLDKVRELGTDPYGSRFTGVTQNAELRRVGESLGIEPGQIVEDGRAHFRSAGRVALYRDTGKLIFVTVRDWSGDIQWAISKKTIEEAGAEGTEARRHGGTEGESAFPGGATAWQVAKLLDLGDLVGAAGRLGRTKTGELTLWVTHIRMLSKCLRPPPEKRLGLTDVEMRYRKRYIDLFANPESRDLFVKRARIIDYIRGVLRERGFIEVETPVLQPIYGGAAARPFVTHHNTLDMKLYLRISPELYLKRCLVGGLERVYEFARCFRNEGISPRHNPEFTMLELYQAYGDYHDMMDITEAIIAGAARDVVGSYVIPFEGRDIDYTPPWPRRPYADLVKEYAGVDIDDHDAVRDKARSLGILAKLAKAHAAVEHGADPAKVSAPGMEQQPAAEAAQVDHVLLVNALFEECVEHHLIRPTFVVDYPAPLCPLTRRHPQNANLALRFEAYVNGMEMGNAYSELNDPEIQRANLEGQVEGEGDETMRVMDDDFVEALEYAMPPAGGLGIGIDRLCMLLTGSPSIREVLLFPLQRPERGGE